MIDLESAGTGPDAAILSIGAVFFDLSKCEIGPTFYKRVHLGTAVQRGGTMDPGTFLWWLGQSEQARNEVRFGGEPIDEVLQAFQQFVLDNARPADVRPWGNAASFDVTIIGQSMERSGLAAPWRFFNERCFRTVKAMYPKVEMDEREGTHHNALDDAIHQVKHLFKIVRTNRGAKVAA